MASAQVDRVPRTCCAKVFIQRDYSEGTFCRFQNKFPPELEGKVEPSVFEQTMNTLNSKYYEAERRASRTYCEGCLACLTAYVIYLCMDTHYEKCLKSIARYIQEQNKSVYLPRGLMIVDPIERGLRVVEICILHDTSGMKS
ncbi:PREDICTED: golgin subfamily A member 7-like [Priapulus caudatus]|uniref:Ras modification protein ERF4 n=1 Tax=Priapulus caudatus TaxID=37621 RepID=A0ABM1EDD1_PRICU|nr:PREDICTED: golgin subfamily A member 7-like [Priapulus caudatus]